MKKKYWIDFSGYVKVEAESEIDAERLFWSQFVKNVSAPFSDDVWDIEGVEEDSNAPLLDTVYSQQDIEDFWYDK